MRKVTLFFCVILISVFAVSCNGTTEMEQDYNHIFVESVTANNDDGNIAENTIDNFSDTRWSAEGENSVIIYDFGKAQTIDYIGMAFYKGDIRYTFFDIEISLDNENWEMIYSGDNNGQNTADMIKIDIDTVEAHYIRITGHGYEYYDGSKTGLWTSITEVHFYSSDDILMDNLETSEIPIEIEYTQPGLINSDGTMHELHIPNDVTGKTIKITKYDADLEMSENDDSIALQNAIDTADFGDEIFLPSGVYDLYQTVNLKSGVNIRGEEGTVLISRPTGDVYPRIVINISGKNDVLISNVHITSDFDGDFTTDHSNNNPDADGPKYVIAIEDASNNKPSYNITVDNVVIEKFMTMGVRISNSHDVVVKNSTFMNATDLGGGGAGYGVSIQGEGNNINRIGYSNDSRYNVIMDCDFVGPYLRHGIIIQYYSHNNLVTGNTFNEIKLDAIDLHGEDEYLNEISTNLIENVLTGAGIGVGNTGATHDASGWGNYIHDNTIKNCREGIKVHLGSSNTIIENNLITEFEVIKSIGIYLQNAPGTIIRGNQILNNSAISFWGIVINADGGTDGRGAGIPVDVTIENNKLSSLPGGVKITAGENLLFNGNTYENIEYVDVLDSRDYEYKAPLLPSQVLDLLNWKINMPINNAMEIKQPDLKTYEHELYFYVNEDQDGVVFNAPCQADDSDATTANSKYPRCELREMAYGGMAQASWDTNNGTHIMTIDQMITSTPLAKPHVVVGQIHDADDDVIMIRLEGNRLFAEAEGVDVGALDENYKLGTRFQVMIKAQNDVVEVYYNDELKVTYPVAKVGCYFKAGMYTQSNVSKGDAPEAYGEVVIYDLSVEHTGIENLNEKTYENVDIPNTESAITLMPVLDTYIDMMKIDGVITGNESPRNEDDKLMVKTSTGQTTIRLTFIEFDISSFTGQPYAALLHLTTKDVNGTSLISVYGLEEPFNELVTWGDLFTIDSRISGANSEVMDYLNFLGQKTGEVEIGPKDPTKEAEDKDKYAVNVSSFVSGAESDTITLVLVESIGVNVNLQMHSTESSTEYAPRLELWTEGGEALVINKEEQEQTEKDAEEDEIEDENAEDTNAGINYDAIDVNEALDLLTYEILVIEDGTIILPSVIGKDVEITWISSNGELISADGLVNMPETAEDVTLIAQLSKNEESTIKEFVIVVKP